MSVVVRDPWAGRSAAGAWPQGSAAIQPRPLACSSGSRAALVQHEGDRLARDAGPVEQARDAAEAGRQFVAVGEVARVDVVAQAQAVLAVEGVGEADLTQVVALLLVVAALGQGGAGDPGGEVGGV